MERILQDVGTGLADVSSTPARSSPLVQFAASATAILARSRNHCEKNDVGLMNALQNAWLAVFSSLSTLGSGLPDPVICNNTSNRSVITMKIFIHHSHTQKHSMK